MKLTSKGKGLGKETKTILNSFSITNGTLNQNKCKGIYINIITYVQPEYDYRKDLSTFKTAFARYMNNHINHTFQSNLDHIIYTVDERDSNLNNRLNTTQTLLPIEISIIFNEKVKYKEILDEILILNKIIVMYFESYKGLNIEAQRHKKN